MENEHTPNDPAGDPVKGQDGEVPAIAWHPAFVQAIQLELDDYKDVLEFRSEYQLSSEPLRIDCVVIKKAPDVKIKKNIAAIFREVNLLEYKSPDDYISVGDFYKVYGYACLYASFEKVSINSMTISFVESRSPRELLAHLENERRYKVEENPSGIYTVSGDILPIQIINSSRLSAEENLWLKDLSYKLAPLEIQQILSEINRHGKGASVGTYLDVITRANQNSIMEALKMGKPILSFVEMLEEVGIAAEWEARGKESEALVIAQNMVNLDLPLETVVSATRLDPEKIKALYRSKEPLLTAAEEG